MLLHCIALHYTQFSISDPGFHTLKASFFRQIETQMEGPEPVQHNTQSHSGLWDVAYTVHWI